MGLDATCLSHQGVQDAYVERITMLGGPSRPKHLVGIDTSHPDPYFYTLPLTKPSQCNRNIQASYRVVSSPKAKQSSPSIQEAQPGKIHQTTHETDKARIRKSYIRIYMRNKSQNKVCLVPSTKSPSITMCRLTQTYQRPNSQWTVKGLCNNTWKDGSLVMGLFARLQ